MEGSLAGGSHPSETHSLSGLQVSPHTRLSQELEGKGSSGAAKEVQPPRAGGRRDTEHPLAAPKVRGGCTLAQHQLATPSPPFQVTRVTTHAISPHKICGETVTF